MDCILSWEDVKDVASEAFHLWDDQPELKWARKAWGIIIRTGLATYSNEDERFEAAIRFLAMCGIYYDFCEIAWELKTDLEYSDWAKQLGIGAVRIGLHLSFNANKCLNASDDNDTLYREGVRYLVNKARFEVCKVLCKGFGNESDDRMGANEAELLLSLWKSNWPEHDPEEEHETDFEILTEVTEAKSAAFEWICDGCESLH
jgi:hypothetical protein